MNPAVKPLTRLAILIGCLALAVASAGVYWRWYYGNYHAVIGGELYRSAQLSVAELKRHLGEDHIATVINLRVPGDAGWWRNEKAACSNLNVAHIDFPLQGGVMPTTAQTAALADLLKSCKTPLLIHCRHGADRTGLAVAIYLADVKGRAPEDAARTAFSAQYGHLPWLFRSVQIYDDAFRAHSGRL